MRAWPARARSGGVLGHDSDADDRLLKARSAAVAFFRSSAAGAEAGTSRATGRSCLVMVISAPRPTRWSNSENLFFASKAPIDA